MKTVNLELSKQLKEAGYPQKTEMWWRIGGKLSEAPKTTLVHESDRHFIGTADSAWLYFVSPTADEILEQLPGRISGNYYRLFIVKTMLDDKDQFELVYQPEAENTEMLVSRLSPSLADAAAEMWLYLKKEGLL